MVASPESIILSKMIYNALLTLLLALLGYLVFSVILGNPIANQGLFLINLVLGALGFSACLTMVSGIASKASNNATLMAILSFPVVIPILLMAIRVSKNAMDGLDWSTSSDKVLTLVAINAIVTVTAYLLFPYVWRS
jgi:heme exporter protein B